MSRNKGDIPGYVSLIFIAAYSGFLVILAVLSVKDHEKGKREYLTRSFSRVSDSKEVQKAYAEKDKETRKVKGNRFYLDDHGDIIKFPVNEK